MHATVASMTFNYLIVIRSFINVMNWRLNMTGEIIRRSCSDHAGLSCIYIY